MQTLPLHDTHIAIIPRRCSSSPAPQGPPSPAAQRGERQKRRRQSMKKTEALFQKTHNPPPSGAQRQPSTAVMAVPRSPSIPQPGQHTAARSHRSTASRATAKTAPTAPNGRGLPSQHRRPRSVPAHSALALAGAACPRTLSSSSSPRHSVAGAHMASGSRSASSV